MKFTFPEPLPATIDPELRVGNVYRCKGGGKTVFWIVVGMTEKMAAVIGINREGEITSASAYGRHVFEGPISRREVVGYCPDLEALEFNIQWMEP